MKNKKGQVQPVSQIRPTPGQINAGGQVKTSPQKTQQVGGKKKSKWWLWVLIILILIIIGVAAYFLFFKNGDVAGVGGLADSKFPSPPALP